MKKFTLILVVVMAAMFSCSNSTEDAGKPSLADIKLPAGFSISVFAEVPNARSLAISPSGTVFVGNRDEDKVYAVKDTNGDFVA